MYYLILAKRSTDQIDYVQSNSLKQPSYENTGLNVDLDDYNVFKIKNPKFKITRDHKVILKNDELIDTEDSTNPFQPTKPVKQSKLAVLLKEKGIISNSEFDTLEG